MATRSLVQEYSKTSLERTCPMRGIGSVAATAQVAASLLNGPGREPLEGDTDRVDETNDVMAE